VAHQIFSEGAMKFSEGTMEEFYEKARKIALSLGLFPSKRWKLLFFRASDGNRRGYGGNHKSWEFQRNSEM